ncbi:MAG: hypothetical protein ABIO04_03065 [Ferruginibacter sp.]
MKPYLPAALRKSVLLFFVSLPFYINAHSQHLGFQTGKIKWEAGLNFGPTFFLGDLGGNAGYGTHFVKDVNLELTKMMKGAFISAYPTDWLGIRIAAQYTYVAGQDYIINTNGVNELWRKQRNLDFKSNVWEVYGAFEIFPKMLLNKYDDNEPLLNPYGFIGVGIFHFDPQGSITNSNGEKTWYKLHPLSTEGQGFAEYPEKRPYSLTQINIPMGAGVKVRVSPRVSLGPELLYRKTFTDYMDDVSTTYIDANYFDVHLSPENAAIAHEISDKTVGIVTPGVNRYEPGTQRGNPVNKDAYFSFVLKLGIKLGDGLSRGDKDAKRQTRCPHFY